MVRSRAWKFSGIAVLVAGAGLGGAALSQPQSQPQPGKPPAGIPRPATMDKKTFIEIIDKAGSPAPQHQLLTALVGEFDCVISLWPIPGSPAITAKATATGRWIMGKRFVEISTSPAAGEELALESMQVLGFDKRSERFFCWSIDSTDTYSLLSRGTCDEQSSTFVFIGDDEVPGRARQSFKQVIHVDSKQTYTSQVWLQTKDAKGADVDGWVKTVEISFTRRGK